MFNDKKCKCYCCGKGTFRMVPGYSAYYCDHCFAIFSMVEIMLYRFPSADYDVPPRTWAREYLGGDGLGTVARLLGTPIVDVRGEPLTDKDLAELMAGAAEAGRSIVDQVLKHGGS